MKKRKIISVIISLALATTLLVGCGGSSKGDNGGTVSSSATMDKTPITLTMYTADLSEDVPFDDDVAKKITELTGVTLKFSHPVGGNNQDVPLMIASGEYPDLIYAKGDTAKLIDAGAIIKLDDYIEKKGNNLKALYGDELNKLRNSLSDPSIYTVGTFGVSSAVYGPGGIMQLQHAVLKELGYPQIKTLQDYENAIKTYIAKHPEINGKKTIGMSLNASGGMWGITCGDVASAVAGIPGDGQFKVDDETQKATYKFELPEVKEYFKWLNHMNAIGLLDPESFTQQGDTFKAKISQGIVLGTADPNWDYDSATKALRGAGMDERTLCPLSVTLNDKCKDQTMRDYGYGGGTGIAISSTSKNKDRAFEFLNWMASDEAQVLVNWGIEGKHYKVENGKRVVLPEIQKMKNEDRNFSKKTGIGGYIYPFPMRGDGAIDPTGNPYSTNILDSVIQNYSEAEKATLAGYGKKTFVEFFPPASELGKSKHGQAWRYTMASDSDAAIIQKKADEYVLKAGTQAVLGSEANFDGAWDKIQQDLKAMNIDKLDESMSQMVTDNMKLWSK